MSTRSKRPADDSIDPVIREAFAPDATAAATDPEDEREGDGESGSVFDLVRKRVGSAPRILLRHLRDVVPPSGPLEVEEGPQKRHRYQVVDEIARGGVGVVLRGRDAEIGRDVAIKILLARHADNPGMVERFLEEAQIEGQLEHPGVVPVHEIGRLEDKRPFFTMKLVKGETLSALLRGRASQGQDRRRYLAIFEKVVETVAYAHSHDVVHRDLKPSNIMVGAFGEVQVMDWGLSKVLGDGGETEEGPPEEGEAAAVQTTGSEPRSETGSVFGTPAYMPPEQARGEVEKLDARSDVFSLGAILCEILTGAPPYHGDSAKAVREEAASARLDDALSRLHSSNADAELIRIARSCLSPAREDRPADAGAVVEALSAYLASVDERARAAEIAAAEAKVRAAEERRARRLTLGLAAAIVTALIAGGAGYVWVAKNRRDRVDSATRAVTLAMEEATRLEGEARAAPNGDATRWTTALAAAKRARALAVQGEVDPDTLRRVTDLTGQIEAGEAEAISAAERAARDRRFVEKLEDIRLRAADLWRTGGDYERPVDEAYASTFREYGIDVESLTAEEVGRRIRETAITDELVAALDDWMFIRARRKSGGADVEWRGLLAVTRVADPDAWRTRFREALGNNDADALQAFIRSAKASELPPASLEHFAINLAGAGDADGAIDFLRGAVRRRRDDFWLNYTLAMLCMNASPRRAQEAVQHFTVASALRSKSPAARSFLGLALYYNDQTDEAIATARETLGLDPNFAGAYITLAVALEKKGKLEAATEAMEAVVRLAPESAPAHLDFANFLRRHGRLDRAIRELKKAIECDPKRAESHDRLGKALRTKGELDGAIRAHEEAIRLNPDYTEAHINLALIRASRGDGEQAIMGLRRAVETNPEHDKALFHLGNLLGRARRTDEAISMLRRAARLNPNEPRTYYLWGNLHFVKREFEDALDVFRAGLRFAPRDALLINGVAKALDSLGRPNEAIEEIDKALEANPKLWRAHYTRGIILKNRKKYERAVASFQETIRLKPDYLQAYLALGNAYLRLGKLAESIQALKRATIVRPEYADAWVNLGVVRKKYGDLPGSVAALRKAIEIDPKHDMARYNLGSTLIKMGEFRQAADTFRAAVRRKPGVADYHLSLGKMRWACGEVDEAVTALREAVRLRPKSADAHFFLGTVFLADGEDADALRHLKSAVRHARENTAYLYRLGFLLVTTGQLDEGLRVLERGRQLAASGGDVAKRFDTWIANGKRMVGLETELDAILSGERKLETFADHIAMAVLLNGMKRYAEAARFWKSTLALKPAAEPRTRYFAACAAARAAAGGTPEESSRWRQHAVQWLRDELESKEKSFREGHVVAAYNTLRRLNIWKHGRALAVIRDEESLAALPPDERKACESLWADVDALLAKAMKRTSGTGE